MCGWHWVPLARLSRSPATLCLRGDRAQTGNNGSFRCHREDCNLVRILQTPDGGRGLSCLGSRCFSVKIKGPQPLIPGPAHNLPVGSDPVPQPSTDTVLIILHAGLIRTGIGFESISEELTRQLIIEFFVGRVNKRGFGINGIQRQLLIGLPGKPGDRHCMMIKRPPENPGGRRSIPAGRGTPVTASTGTSQAESTALFSK